MKILITLCLSLGMIMTANAATFYVNSRADPGDGVCDATCTLRDAIIAANADAALDIIDFSAIKNPNGPVVTIQPLSPLPPITAPVIIDGSINELRNDLPGDIVLNAGAGFSLSGSGPSKRPGIELDGSLAIVTSALIPGAFIAPFHNAVPCDPILPVGARCYDTDPLDPGNPELFVFDDKNKALKVGKARAHAFWLQDHLGSTIRGFVINRFSGSGVFVDKGGEHHVLGNYIGTDITGTKTGTTVGPLGDPQTYLVRDTNPASPSFLWNERDPTIDSTIAYGNGYPAIRNTATASPQGPIERWRGILITNSSDNQVGSLDANDRNIVAANGDDGVLVVGNVLGFGAPPIAPADRNLVKGNFIGTGVYGTEALGNYVHGVSLGANGDTDNRVIANVVSDNGFEGDAVIFTFWSGVIHGNDNKTHVAHNHVGTDVSGLVPLGNGGEGIITINTSSSHLKNNLISANGFSGMFSLSGDDILIKENVIGTNIHKDLSNEAFANGAYGIILFGEELALGFGVPGTNHQILNNFIANNKLAGITVLFNEDLRIEENVVLNNGFAKGLIVPDFGVVDGALHAGIEVLNQSTRVDILNNWVGIDPSNPMDSTLGNAEGGIVITSFTVLQLYPSIFSFWFLVPQHVLSAGLTGYPIGPTEVLLQGNTVAYNEGSSGFLVGGDVDNEVTAFCSVNLCFDLFAFLGSGGTVFLPTTPPPYNDGLPGQALSVTMLGNSIFANNGLGIDLTQAHQTATFPSQDTWTVAVAAADGVNANDPGDVDAGGPNNLQNYPTLEDGEAAAAGNHLKKVKGTLDSLPGNYRVEFYVNENDDPSGHGEGEKFAGFIEFEIVGPGPHSFTLMCNGIDAANGCPKVDVPTPLQKLNVTATATNLDTGETSEFAKNVALGSK